MTASARSLTLKLLGPCLGSGDQAWLSDPLCPGMVSCSIRPKSFDELSAKWDRHISHDFAERAQKPALRLRWVLRAFAVAVSPAFEVRRILTSARVSTWRERRLAALVLIRIRLYRAVRMLKLLLNGVDTNSSKSGIRVDHCKALP